MNQTLNEYTTGKDPANFLIMNAGTGIQKMLLLNHLCKTKQQWSALSVKINSKVRMK